MVNVVNFLMALTKSLIIYHKILWKCTFWYKNLLNFTLYTKKFNNCHLVNKGCDYIYTTKLQLKSHIRKHLPRKKNHKCKFCPKTFSGPGEKSRHENTIHLNVRELKCEKCEFTTNRSHHLKDHKESIHDGIFYECEYPGCNKSYNLKRNLDAHKWTSHKIAKPGYEGRNKVQNIGIAAVYSTHLQ